jgi:TrwC relaxase
MARGADGRWTALDGTPIYQHAKAAGFLYQAHLRAAVRERLPWVRWGPVRNGMAEIEQIAPGVLREFSTRRRQIEERERELIAAGVDVGDAGREAIAHDTRLRKRYGVDTAPWKEVVRARAAEHGLGARELDTLTREPGRPREVPDARAVCAKLAGGAGLTERQNTFATRDAVIAWAAAHGQGAPAAGSSAPPPTSSRAQTCIARRMPTSVGSRPAICSPTRRRSSGVRRLAAVRAREGSIARWSTRCSEARPSRRPASRRRRSGA